MGVYYTYMIRLVTVKKHYYGHTNDLQERMHQHNSGQSPFTRGKGPWELIEYNTFPSKAEAAACEIKLKNMKNPSRAYHWLKRNGSLT